eukprot:TRINITY_DN43686_c0_g1_i1.p1 TRINITY_DN43686_c0_g1~~TRINITY_DN43686_c0_g1_i1.p1  ORF type:complete len:249 (-),score=18.22 TRINITY_DN43686_c0_g1_i1:275-988(-)
MRQAHSADHLTKFSGVRTSPKWSFRGKPNNDIRKDTPGPGQYTVPETESVKFATSSRYGFGTSPRHLVRPHTAPGPGEYTPAHPSLRRSGGFGFGTSVRHGMKGMSETTPGPGSYGHQEKMGVEGPKYSQSSRRLGHKPPEVPGPGAYHQADPPVADLNASALLPHSQRAPKWGFGTSPRQGLISSGTPGPGAYDHKPELSKSSSPKYSIKGRVDTRRSVETPGPGTYGGALTQFGY